MYMYTPCQQVIVTRDLRFVYRVRSRDHTPLFGLFIYDKQNSNRKNDWATRTPLKTRDEFRCSGRISNSWSTRDTHLCVFLCCKVRCCSINKYIWWPHETEKTMSHKTVHYILVVHASYVCSVCFREQEKCSY